MVILDRIELIAAACLRLRVPMIRTLLSEEMMMGDIGRSVIWLDSEEVSISESDRGVLGGVIGDILLMKICSSIDSL